MTPQTQNGNESTDGPTGNGRSRSVAIPDMVIPEGPDGPDGRSALTDAPIRAPAVIDDRSIATVKRVRFAEKLLDYCDNIIMERADTGRASEDSYHEGDEGRIDTYDEGEDTDDEWEPIARPCSSPKGAAGPGDGAGRSGKGVLPAAVAEPEDSDQNHHEEKNQRKEPLPPPPAVGGREEDDEHIGEDYDDESKEKDEDAAGHQEGQGRHQSLFAALRRDAELLPHGGDRTWFWVDRTFRGHKCGSLARSALN